MNEEALQDSFNLFTGNGYNGSLEDYKELITSDNEAFNDSYSLFESNGYNGTKNDFSALIGVDSVISLSDEELGKTNDSASADPSVESENNMGSQSANGLSELKETEPISNWQSIKNSFSNMGEQVGDVYEYWFEDDGANAALDIATNSVYSAISGQDTIDDFVKEQGKDSWIAEGLGSEATLEAIKKYEIEQSKTKRTKGVIESFKDGNIGGVLAGTVNALTSMVGSVAYGAGTLGSGFFMDYVAENYIEYNKLKAENLGVTLSELVASGEADNAVPIGMGTISTGLELIGLGLIGKGVKGAVKGKGGNTGLLGSASKYLAEKLIYSKGARASMNVLGTGATEFTTEILQHASDQVNLELGRVAGTDEEAQIGKTFIDAVTSEEGLEAGIQGFLGGAGMTSGSYSAKAMNTIRNVVDEDAVNKSLIKLGTLEANLKAATDPTVKKGIEAQIEAQSIEISDLVDKGNDIYNSLSDGDISKIENLRDLADAAAFQVTELGKKLRKGDISQKQYELSKGGFEIEYKAARQGLIDMELDKNIAAAETIAKEKGLGIDVMATPEVEALMNSDKISEQNRKSYFDNKKKGFEQSAFVIGNKIVIDKDIARKTGSINAGMHEVLHPVLNKLIGGVKEQGRMVRQFRKSMTSSQRRFVDVQMKKRGYTGKQYNTEYVNVFSDALRKKQINYDKTTFEKIGDAIVSVFKPVGYTNIGFESGKDVYNFIKEFDQSAEQGKLTTKAAEALKDVDLSDAGLQDEIQTSKTIAEAELALQEAQDADPNDPRYFDNLDKAEAALDAAEDAAKNPQAPAPEVKKETKPKPKPKVTRPEKPTRTTDLGPRDPISKKIMDTYNEGMEGVERSEYKGNKPLPASLERKLVPLFEGYINTIVQQKFKQFATEALEFQDALSILRAEVISAIRTYDPAKNKDLAGYVKKIVQTRQSLMFKEANTEFTSNLDDAKGVTSTDDVQSIDRSGTVERGQATFDELDIVDDTLIEDIKNDLEKEIRVRVQKGTLSETVSVKKGRETYIVSWLENYVNKQLFKKLLKKVGAITGVYPNAVIPGAYIDFLNDPKTFDIVTKALPIKSIKKSYGKLFPIERVGRELTAEGNPVFRIKPIDKKAFLTYFVKGKKSAVLERQKQLFREILEPLAKQVVADYATPENLSQLKSIQELAPAESMDVIENIAIDAQLSNLESKLDRYSEEESGFDIIQFSLDNQTAPDQLASIAGLDYKNISLKDSNKGKQKFYIERLEEYYKQREKFMSFLPPSITKFRGLTAAMLGFVYREDGSYYDFYKFNYKKVIDKKGEIVIDKNRLKSLFEKGTAEYKNKLLDKKGDSSKYSETTKKLLKEINELIEKANLGKLTPNLHYGRIAVAKTELAPIVTENTAKEVLDHLSKNNELNAKIAELYISLLRDFVKNSNNKDQAKSTVVNMLLATNNTVNGWRSLAAITSIIYNKNKSVDYYFEHNDSMRSALPNILKQILGDGTISFKVDASLIPKSLAKEKNKNQKTKIGNRSVTDAFYKEALKENKDLKIVQLSKSTIAQFSLNSATDIEFIESQVFKSTKTTVFEINGIEYIGSMTGFDNARGNIFEAEDLIDKLEQVTGNKNVETNRYQLFAFDRSDTGAEVVSRDSAEWNGKRYVFPESDTKQSLAVFGSLSNYFLNEIKKGNLDGLVFAGVEDSRKRLYQTLSERFSKQLGWNFGIIEAPEIKGGNTYFIAKPAAVKAEMKNTDLIQFSKTLSKAKAMANRSDAPQKGISVWDFDDTLATTKSNVLYTLPDGTKGKINATEFALKADKLAAQGAEFDFSEFKKVMEGAKGPMFNKAVDRNKKFGNDNVFILTARPADSKYAIHDFLSAIGLNIKIENIVGLGDGTAIAKAKWVIGKVAEGYNDFYFADDAYKNVKAVQEVLEEADVKSKVHQAKVQFSKDLNKEFNNIIEDVTGIESFKTFSEAKGKVRGQNKGKYKFFIPPSAEDFAGLLYKLTGKGKAGEAQQAWFKEALFDPFAKAMREFESYKQNVTGIVNQLKKDIKNVPSGLKKVNETGFTNEVAVRVYLWAKNGYDINGLSETDKKELIAIVQANPDLLDFANQMDSVLEAYPEPQNDWLAGTITTDAINMINTTKRAEFLEAWQNNADAVFTKENFNKLRAAFGDNYVEAMQDMLYRMKTGRNRPSGANKLTNKFMNWVNDSVGTIMFFNTRSALLQTLSIVNFINWGDNNPMAAAKAFANQKQFWSDFAMLFNSDFLKQRRSGLKNDVNADDIANAAETATNKTKAVLSSLLKMGFLPTQMADSFAIAIGGASFIRNRINKYVSEGMDKQAAEEQAFLDFQETAEETQQSSRPDRVSQQQASPLGRIVLAFANTPMQYMRLTKKAFLDLKNGRGDAKTNITKIAYYMAVQNIIFSSLQAALFAAAFDDDEEALDKKEVRIANSMLDSILRGVGVYGAIASTLKNIVIEIKTQAEKDRPDFTIAAQRALSISPPIDSKMRKLMSAGRAFSYKTTREKMVGFGLDNPAFYAGGQIVSSLTNVPLDRAIRKADNIRAAVDNDTKYWQSIALMLGYSQWDVGLVETSKNKKGKSDWGSTTKWKKKGSWKKEKGSWKK